MNNWNVDPVWKIDEQELHVLSLATRCLLDRRGVDLPVNETMLKQWSYYFHTQPSLEVTPSQEEVDFFETIIIEELSRLSRYSDDTILRCGLPNCTVRNHRSHLWRFLNEKLGVPLDGEAQNYLPPKQNIIQKIYKENENLDVKIWLWEKRKYKKWLDAIERAMNKKT